MSSARLYGVVLEFDSPATLVAGAKAVKLLGFKKFEAYTPYPIKELDEVVPGINPVPLMVLVGGVIGALTAIVMQYYVAVYEYPINVGGRPLNSWPSYIPIVFEITVLFASLAAFLGTLWLAGLPLLHHPVFNVQGFARASQDGFFLIVEAHDLEFAKSSAREELHKIGAIHVQDVEEEA